VCGVADLIRPRHIHIHVYLSWITNAFDATSESCRISVCRLAYVAYQCRISVSHISVSCCVPHKGRSNVYTCICFTSSKCTRSEKRVMSEKPVTSNLVSRTSHTYLYTCCMDTTCTRCENRVMSHVGASYRKSVTYIYINVAHVS